MRLGGLHFAERDFVAAAHVFEELRRHHRNGRRYQQATYWAGRAYLAHGKTALGRERLRQARRAEPLSFYGIAAGERPTANYVAGSMANSALMTMTRALGVESMRHGVRVVGVNPGYIETDRQIVRWKARAKNELGDESRWRELTTVFPLGRLGTVDEVANTVAFLASDASSYTSGAVVTIDGGLFHRPPQVNEW